VARREYEFFVYILSSRSRTLYIGVTENLRTRVLQHRDKKQGSFTARYNIDRLVYFERYQYIDNAIAREKELKDWNRARKIALIESINPTWEDLAAELERAKADPSATLRDDKRGPDGSRSGARGEA
jgi:putative endonuclease